MKLCSQCAFTFEDHLQFCDFDGTELTIIPEPVPNFKNMSMPATGLPSLFSHVCRSPVFHGALTFAAVMLSALLIGYYDAESRTNIDTASNAESGNDIMTVPEAPSESSDQAQPEQFVKPSFVSTQRTISADEKLSAIAIRSPSTGSRTGKRVPAATPKPAANRRRVENANKELLARNQKPGSTKTDRQPLARKRPAERESESAHQKRNSKVVAILKRTGRILKRPFQF